MLEVIAEVETKPIVSWDSEVSVLSKKIKDGVLIIEGKVMCPDTIVSLSKSCRVIIIKGNKDLVKQLIPNLIESEVIFVDEKWYEIKAPENPGYFKLKNFENL